MGVYPTGPHVLCGFEEGAEPFHPLLEGCLAEWGPRWPSATGPLVPYKCAGVVSAECEAAGIRNSTSKVEATILRQKRWFSLSWSVQSLSHYWRRTSMLGSCSRVRERWSIWSGSAASAMMSHYIDWLWWRRSWVERQCSRFLNLHPYLHVWPWVLGCHQKDKIPVSTVGQLSAPLDID